MTDETSEEPPGQKKIYQLPKKVGIIYSQVKRHYFPTEAQYLSEKDSFVDAQKVAFYVRKLGIKISLYPGNSKLANKLREDKPDIVLNMAGSVRGHEWLASTIPALLELLEIPYTGTGILGESLSYNKFLIKKLLEQNGVPVPHYQLVNKASDPLDPTLRYPLISKLNEIHGAVEITEDSVSENEKHLQQRLDTLIKTYHQPILIEEFIVGREITAILLEGMNKKIYLAERIFDVHRKYSFTTFEDQWLDKKMTACHYQKYHDPLLSAYVKKAFEVTKMDDYGKFDIRLDSSGRYYFIDSNSNPAFGPKEVDCALAYILDLYKVPFMNILKRLLLSTMHPTNGKKALTVVNGSSHAKRSTDN